MKLKIKDLQFPRYFLTHEIDLHRDITSRVLDQEIEIINDGQADSLSVQNDVIIYQNPSSVSRFLFNVLYHSLQGFLHNDIYKDKLGLGLLYMCQKYVYADYRIKNFTSPPIISNFNKFHVPSFIVRELVEPIIGEVQDYSILSVRCRYTDNCRAIDNANDLHKQYNMLSGDLRNDDMPLILLNQNVHNIAAQSAHLTYLTMKMSLGAKTDKVIKNILLDPDESLLGNLLLILRTLNKEKDFVVDFLKFFGSHVELTTKEKATTNNNLQKEIAADRELRLKLKTADNYTPTVWQQFSQWSMLMGLIEKQLGPMRGSMWPTSELVKPHEDQLRVMIREEAKAKNKNQLNFEELLEVARSRYNHNAIEPGKLTEEMMKDERVWN